MKKTFILIVTISVGLAFALVIQGNAMYRQKQQYENKIEKLKQEVDDWKSDAYKYSEKELDCLDAWEKSDLEKTIRIVNLQQRVVKIRNEYQMQLNKCIVKRLNNE